MSGIVKYLETPEYKHTVLYTCTSLDSSCTCVYSMAMALAAADLKQELASLREKRVELDRKIAGLELFLGVSKSLPPKVVGEVVSARSVELDIRPTVRAILQESGNAPIAYKDLIDRVAGIHAEVDRSVIKAKMVHVKRTILDQAEYGKYRLKTEAAEVVDNQV